MDKKQIKLNKDFTKLTHKGVSLIVLIVTIIVIVILAATVILTLSKNNPIESAREARFKEDVRTFQDELNMVIAKEYTSLQGQRDKKITALEYIEKGDKNSVYTYLSSFTKKYENKIGIKEDEIVYVGFDEKEREWFDSIMFKYYESNKKYWDIEYDYSMGALENNGFTKEISGVCDSYIIEDGFLLTAGSGHIIYNPRIVKANKAEAEVIIYLKKSAESDYGFRFDLSNGTYACHICIKKGGLYVDESQTKQNYIGTKYISKINLNTEYKINVYFDEKEGCKVALNDKLIYEGKIFSYNWTIRNYIIQQNGGETVIKSIKYKFYE